MTHNPKAPWPRSTPGRQDRQHPRDAFANRLRQLGAADDIVADVIAAWDDPAWDNRDEVVAYSDEALAAELREIEAEFRNGTRTPEEDEADEHERVVAEAEALSGANVDDVNAWVDEAAPGTKALRAWAVMRLEHEREKPRKGVLEHVTAVLDAEETDGAGAPT